jgi:hypothetical protein
METEEFKINDQVVVKREMRNGTLIRIGSIVRINAGAENALVHFPIDHAQATVPFSQMERTQSAFSGRARVQVNPAYRGIGQLL